MAVELHMIAELVTHGCELPWALGTEPRSSQEQQVLLTADLSLHFFSAPDTHTFF